MRNTIAQEFAIPYSGKVNYNEPLRQAKSLAAALLKYKFPKEKVELYETFLKTYLQKNEIVKQDLVELMKLNHIISKVNHGEFVVNKLPNVYAFIGRWRAFFVKNMTPQFLPDSWYEFETIFLIK